MRILKYVLIFVLLCIPSISYGASSASWNFFDPEFGIRPDTEVSIHHNGISAFPFGIEGFIDIDPDHEEFNSATGELYIVDELTGTRELVVYIEDGGTPVTWNREGVYELDVYGFLEVPMRAPKSLFEHFVLWMFGETAHAAFGTYVDTIRFTVTEAPPSSAPCCSSVLFLPGIKGSVLKTENDTLWPADAFGGDIPQLALTEAGESVNDVVVSGILNTFPVGPFSVSVYRDFSTFMDGLTEDEGDGTINEWIPYAYDWRYSLNKTLEEGAFWEDEGENVLLTDVIEDLAFESKTGKVTIVAHSMGGLLGKLLIQKLEQEGNADLVDAFVMVGTPQLGTPQGIASLLHGDDEGILQGIIVDRRNVRAVAQNMQSAHDLLPSPKYFEEVSDPVFIFNQNASFTDEWRNYWGNCLPNVSCINGYEAFKEFVTGQGVSRISPPQGQVQTPEVLREELVENSRILHEGLDEYEFPAHIRVVQIAGWGRPTVRSVEYKNVHGLPGYETGFTSEGDKTVIYPSALLFEQESYFFDLEEYRRAQGGKFEHKDLVAAGPIKETIVNILKKNEINQTSYFSINRPNIQDYPKQLLIMTRSPVALYAEDESRNITGVHPSQELSSEALYISEDIPGSSFLSYGGDQYLFLPEEGSYNFNIKGTGTGPATIEIGSFENDTTTFQATYTDIPVTENTQVIFTVDQNIPENTVLQVDLEGGGTYTELYPDNYEPPEEELTVSGMIALLREKIEALDAKNKLKKKLLKRLDRLEKFLEKNKKKQKILNRMKTIIERKVYKGKIQEETGEELTKLLEDIENAIY